MRNSGCRVRRAAGAGGKDLSWEPLRPELVVEVAMSICSADASGTWRTFAAGARIAARVCTYAQLEVAPPEELAGMFAHREKRRVKA